PTRYIHSFPTRRSSDLHKDLRGNPSVTGQELGDGLDQSGRPVPRVDRIMEKAITEAHVLKTGIKRSTRYRLTNQGLAKALNIAKDRKSTRLNSSHSQIS